MRKQEFRRFMEIAETNGLLDEGLQASGYLWINLTPRQVKVVRGLAFLQGFLADENGNMRVGNYILKGCVNMTKWKKYLKTKGVKFENDYVYLSYEEGAYTLEGRYVGIRRNERGCRK